MTMNEIAEAYVMNYTSNNPHDDEEAALNAAGIDHDSLIDILDLHGLAREGDVNAMTEAAFDAAVDAAARDIVARIAD